MCGRGLADPRPGEGAGARGWHVHEHDRANTLATNTKLPIEAEQKVSSQNRGSLKRCQEETAGIQPSVVRVPRLKKATEAWRALRTAPSGALES